MCGARGSACFYFVWRSQYRGQAQWLSSGKVSAEARARQAGDPCRNIPAHTSNTQKNMIYYS